LRWLERLDVGHGGLCERGREQHNATSGRRMDGSSLSTMVAKRGSFHKEVGQVLTIAEC
jgi:hypothetical protein